MQKKNLKMRVVVAPTPTVIAAAYDENGKTDACTLAFYSPISHVQPCVVIGINATQKRKTLKSILSSGDRHDMSIGGFFYCLPFVHLCYVT